MKIEPTAIEAIEASVMKTAKAFDHGNNSSSMSRYGHEEAKMSQAGQ